MAASDPWSTPSEEPSIGVERIDTYGSEMSAGPPAASKGDLYRRIGAALLVAAGALIFALLLFVHSGAVATYEYPITDAMDGLTGLALWGVALLALSRRTYRLGTAMAWSLSVALIVGELPALGPGYSAANVESPSFWLVLTAECVALAAAGVLSAGILRDRAGSMPGNPIGRRSRIFLAAVGLLGVAGWFLGSAQTWVTTTTSFADGSSGGVTAVCCSLSQYTGWMWTTSLLSAAVIAAAVVAPIWMRSRGLGVGLALGAVLSTAPNIAATLVQIAAPKKAYIGLSSVAEYGSDL
jgi:hypothetical protein